MPPHLPNRLIPYLSKFYAPYKGFLIAFILLASLSGLYGAINSYLMKVMIDRLTHLTQLTETFKILWLPAIAFALNFEIHSLSWRGMDYVNLKVAPLVRNQMVSQTFLYVLNHSHQFFQDHLAGSISNNIGILADNLEEAMHSISRFIIRGVVMLIAGLVTLYFVHPVFAGLLFIWTVGFTAITLAFSGKIQNLADDYARAQSVVSGKVVDGISNAQSIRAFARQSFEQLYLSKFLTILKQKFRSKEKFMLIFSLLRGFSVTVLILCMLWGLIYLRAQESVTIGDFALVLLLAIFVVESVWWVTEQIEMLNTRIGKCKQSLNALLLPLEIEDQPNAGTLHVSEGEIVFNEVQFQYSGSEPLFQNKSVTIEAGQKVGLVGYSGGGKTTFVNLILRLFDTTAGHILIDGQDIKTVTQDSLRAAIGMIPQDPSLFHRTLMENIRYGNLDATDEEVILAAQKAYAHEFIIKLPQGYETLVGERGIKLSGGQRQRVAIARAILKNAPILILDEATSQLDSVTESEIQSSMWELMQNKTTLVIAHRLSTLLHMDRILVFDSGKIVEDGSHQELLNQGGLYKILWEAQVGGFLLDKQSNDHQ